MLLNFLNDALLVHIVIVRLLLHFLVVLAYYIVSLIFTVILVVAPPTPVISIVVLVAVILLSFSLCNSLTHLRCCIYCFVSLLLLLPLNFLCLLHFEEVQLSHKRMVPDESCGAVRKPDLLLVIREVVHDLVHLGW